MFHYSALQIKFFVRIKSYYFILFNFIDRQMVYINYGIFVEHTTRFDLTEIFAICEWAFN